MNIRRMIRPAWVGPLVGLALLAGCERQAAPAAGQAAKGGSKATPGPDSSAIKPVLDQGWCGGHGVPESVCTRCNDKLIDTFKKAGDWCKEHKLPESQCAKCFPEVSTRWAALKPAGASGNSEHGTAAPAMADSSKAAAGPSGRLPGPDTSPIKPVLDQGWCGGHAVPESVCTRCNDKLIDTFKKAGDWCGEHNLPNSQCIKCDPEVEARWAALNPNNQTGSQVAAAPVGPATEPGGAKPADPATWCFDHGVTKDACTRCDSKLIQKFKDNQDWCQEHALPESQCVKCNPEVRQKWEGLRPRTAPPGPPGRESMVRIERAGRTFASDQNDPLCLVEISTIRFLDAGIARQAGIEVTTVQPRRMSATVEVPAEVEFDATRVTRITPRVAGIARDVPVRQGDTVRTGDLLAVLDSAALGEAKSQFIERQQDLHVAQAEFQRVQAVYEGTDRLLAVATATASASEIQSRLEGVPVGETKARMLRAHASLQLARAEAVREAQLFERKINAERDVQSARATLAAAEAEFLAIREEVGLARQKDRASVERGVRVARSGLDAAQRRLQILGLTGEQIEAIGSEGDEALSRYELRSPAGGRVVERNVTPGEAVADSHAMFVIADTSQLWLLGSVDERDLPLLRENQPVMFTVEGLPGDSFAGRLSWISSQVDDRTRLVPVRASVSNEAGTLRARMFGRARIVLRENEEVLSVPIESVQTDGCCQLVFVREAEDQYAPRKVRLGVRSGGYVEALRGLRAGEPVATTGSFLLKTEILKGNIGAGCCEVETGR